MSNIDATDWWILEYTINTGVFCVGNVCMFHNDNLGDLEMDAKLEAHKQLNLKNENNESYYMPLLQNNEMRWLGRQQIVEICSKFWFQS